MLQRITLERAEPAPFRAFLEQRARHPRQELLDRDAILQLLQIVGGAPLEEPDQLLGRHAVERGYLVDLLALDHPAGHLHAVVDR
jgi:hypothetical protein